MNNRPGPFQWVRFTDAALDDLRSVNDRARPVLMQVFTVLKPLDLTDCGKLVVHTDGHPEYRIVVRSAAGVFEVSVAGRSPSRGIAAVRRSSPTGGVHELGGRPSGPCRGSGQFSPDVARDRS